MALQPGDARVRVGVRGGAIVALLLTALLVGCAPARPPGTVQPVEAPPPPPLPPVPWRDDVAGSLATGSIQWNDASRDRAIQGRWTAPSGGSQGLVIVLPGLAQGAQIPVALAETLAHGGFAVLALGHPGNDATIWQGPEARRADFEMAARRVYAASEVAARVADVRFVLAALEREPPSWLPRTWTRLGVVGIGPGAQTAQWLVGEWMARDVPPAAERRIAAAALIGPYVGFDGPALYQRYGTVTTPLLLAYGLAETDPYGLGMTSQQRRAMVNQLVNARIVELRLPASTVAALQLPGAPKAADSGPTTRMPPAGSMIPDTPTRGGGGRGGPSGTPAGAQGGPPPEMSMMSGASQANRGAQAARVAVLFSVSAFFEAELLGSADARDWLQGSHPGPVQWNFLPAGRPASAQPR